MTYKEKKIIIINVLFIIPFIFKSKNTIFKRTFFEKNVVKLYYSGIELFNISYINNAFKNTGDIMKIGEKLKKLRLSRGLTQEELAVRADLTRGFISQLERDLTSPTLESLEMILRALGTNLKEFFSDFEEKKIIYKKSERVPLYDTPDGVKEELLMTDTEVKKIEPMIVELEPQSQTEEEDYHEGSEFGYVLEGNIELWLDNAKYKAKTGDAFYFKSDKKHYIKNASRKKKARVLWIEIH
nr:cupin domain-containing protein [Marinitoga sp. 1138]